MIDHPLTLLIMMLAAAVLVVTVVKRLLHLPPILGYLAVGILMGPHLLDVVAHSPEIEFVAEFGVVFLLFALGLEFSFVQMLAMRREVFLLGGLQVSLATAIVTAILISLGYGAPESLVLGGAFAMSSTAIVVRMLTEQVELGRPHGRYSIGILLFQDIAVVPFLIVISVMAVPDRQPAMQEILIAGLQGIAALILVLAAGRWLVRPLFHEIARSKLAELFTLTVLLVAIGAAWITHLVGMSMALGAFLAGMMIGETEYRHQVQADIRPFRDILLGLFFISIGVQLDLPLLAAEVWVIVLMLLLLIVGKFLLITPLARLCGARREDAVRTGVVLAHGGEFGIALLTLGLQEVMLPPQIAQPLLAAIVVSMVASVFLFRKSANIAAVFSDKTAEDLSDLAHESAATDELSKREHVIVCGYGRVGQNLARLILEHGFEYIALDLDPYRVRSARQAGDPVVYGDSTKPDVLRAVGIEHASVVVISMPDLEQAEQTLQTIKSLRADVPVLIRTRDDTDLDMLLEAGATEVVPETLESSLMLASHLLLLLHVPLSKVLRTVQKVRSQRYKMLRNIFRKESARPIDTTHALREELHSVALPPGAYGVGRKISDLNLEDAEIFITAIRRDGIVGRQPVPETELKQDDVLVLYGTPEALEHGESILLTGWQG